MLRPNALVSVYLDDNRPLPTEILYIILQYSGLIRVGKSSVHFWINWRSSSLRKPAGRSPRLSH